MISEDAKARMRAIVARYPVARSGMLPCLHIAQEEEGMVTPAGIQAVADAIGAKPDEVESVVTFYSMYHQELLGRHVISVCTSISCYLRGCDELMARLEDRLGVRRGETSRDGRYTLRGVECLAGCGMAPVLQVDGAFVEHVTAERMEELAVRLERDEDLGSLVSTWRAMGNGGYTAADGLGPTHQASQGEQGTGTHPSAQHTETQRKGAR